MGTEHQRARIGPLTPTGPHPVQPMGLQARAQLRIPSEVVCRVRIRVYLRDVRERGAAVE